MQRIEIAKIYSSPNDFADKKITVCGWVRTIRDSKALGFIDLNDGSYFKGIQIVFEEQAINNFTEIAKQNVGTALVVTGTLVLTPEAKQPFEIKAEEIFVEGSSSPEYPLLPLLLQFINSLIQTDLFMHIRRSFLAVTARVPEKCSA